VVPKWLLNRRLENMKLSILLDFCINCTAYRDGHGSGPLSWVGLDWVGLGHKFQSSSGLD